jgi:tRNA G10  N-methylase Trm11
VTVKDSLGRPAVHPFAARMAPAVALGAMRRLAKRSRVLDPMVGSGTVAAVAQQCGHYAFGFDLDPLAVLMARVWTTPAERLTTLRRAETVLANARRRATRLKAAAAYPVASDHETKKFLRYWFDPYVRRQLTALAEEIKHERNGIARRVMWCAFSRLIIAKQAGASRAMDLTHSRPHRAFERAPRKPFSHFVRSVAVVLNGCAEASGSARVPRASIRRGDVRRIAVPDASIDLVVTSPPYLNAIDYLRTSKFALVWMGYSVSHLREIRRRSIGAEVGQELRKECIGLKESLRLAPGINTRLDRILNRYLNDTLRSLLEVRRVLKPGGTAIYVVGENQTRGVYIPTGRIVQRCARSVGLVVKGRRSRQLSERHRYLPPPGSGSGKMDARMTREVVVTLRAPRE